MRIDNDKENQNSAEKDSATEKHICDAYTVGTINQILFILNYDTPGVLSEEEKRKVLSEYNSSFVQELQNRGFIEAESKN